MAPQKKYICAFCARAFSRSEHKQRHERSHTNEKPFHCQYCPSAFVRRDLLQRHCRTVHNVNMVPSGNSKRKTSAPASSSSSCNVMSLPASPEYEEDHASPPSSCPTSHPIQQHQNPKHIPSQSQSQNRSLHQSQNIHLRLHLNLPDIKLVNSGVKPMIPHSMMPTILFVSPLEVMEDRDAATNDPNSSPKLPNTGLVNSSSQIEKTIVQSLSFSKKLSIAISNFEKISILQTRDPQGISYVGSNINSIIPISDLNLSKSIDDYLLGWNILNKLKLPTFENINKEINEFIDSFSNLSSISLLTRFHMKFNEPSNEVINLSVADNKKILNIECQTCLLFSILSIGAIIYNNDNDCVQLFMKSWNLLLTNLIPRLNDSTKLIDEKEQGNYNYPIIKDQIQILKNLFTLAYICFNLDESLKDLTSNNLNGDLIFNYLDDISFIIMSHLEDNKTRNCSRTSSSSSVYSTAGNSTKNPNDFTNTTDGIGSINDTPSNLISSTPGSDCSIIDDNLSLFWSIYLLLSHYFMINNRPPPKIYKFLLEKQLYGSTNVLVDVMENLTKSTIPSESDFNNEIVSISLSNELQCLLHFGHMLVNDLKRVLHNAIIFTNMSLNQSNQPESSLSGIVNNNSEYHQNNLFNDDGYIFEMFKKKMVVNSPSKYQGLLNSYIFNPTCNYNWNLLYISLKEFNGEHYSIVDDNDNIPKFKFSGIFQRFFHNFDIKSDVELEITKNIQFQKDEYQQFVKYFLPLLKKLNINNLDVMETDDDDDIEISAVSTKDKNIEEPIINNNLGISCLPILFNYQFIKINPGLMKWNKQSKLNNFERKRFNYLLMEWYLTILKLVVGLKNDSTVYDMKKDHRRSHLQDSLESFKSQFKNKKNTGEYSLANNYIFQCLIYLVREVGGKVKLPNGTFTQLRDYDEFLNFEADEFRINDEIIYCIVKNLGEILEEWICEINVNGSNIIKSNGFGNLKKFVDDYVISQLNLGEGKYYPMENYVFGHQQSKEIHVAAVPAPVHATSAFGPPPPQEVHQHTSLHQQQFSHTSQHVPFQRTLIPVMVQSHVPFNLPPQQESQVNQAGLQNLYLMFQQPTGQTLQPVKPHKPEASYKEVVLPPILPPLTKNEHKEFSYRHHPQNITLQHNRFQFPDRKKSVHKH